MIRSRHFISGRRVAVDTETTGLRPWQGDRAFGFSFCNEDGDTAYFEWPVDPFTRKVTPVQSELDAIGEFMLDPKVRKDFWHAKFDVRMFEMLGIQLVKDGRCVVPIYDIMFAAHACDTLESDYKLKRIAQAYLDFDNKDETELHKLVVRLRRHAKKAGWKIAYEEKLKYDGTIEHKAIVQADYWLPCAAKKEWLKRPSERTACRKYAVCDAERTMLLGLMYDDVMKRRDVLKTFELETELFPVIYEIESIGIRIDPKRNSAEEKNNLQNFRQHIKDLKKSAWPTFDLEKKGDVQKLVYDKKYLNLPVLVRTDKTKEPATNVEALKSHYHHPVVQLIFKARAAHKAWSTFFRKYSLLTVKDKNGYSIHTDFRQVGPVTGRLSSSTPNLQNVANALSTRSQEPIQARTPFGPRAGCVWTHSDYHQVEVRVFADLAQEPFMLKALADGRDLHTECANRVWGGRDNPAAIREAIQTLEIDGSGDEKKKPEILELWERYEINPKRLHRYGMPELEKIARYWLDEHDWDVVKGQKTVKKKTARAKAKMFLFRKVYGGGSAGAAPLIGCTPSEAVQYGNEYDREFPRIKAYSLELRQIIKKHGCIRSAFGRRLSVDLESAYRAVNYIVQGSCADLLKLAMLKVTKFLRESGLDARLVLSVHDELVVEWRKEDCLRPAVLEVARLQADHEGAFGVPTPVEVEICRSSWNVKEKLSWIDGAVYADGTIKKAEE